MLVSYHTEKFYESFSFNLNIIDVYIIILVWFRFFRSAKNNIVGFAYVEGQLVGLKAGNQFRQFFVKGRCDMIKIFVGV